MRHKFICCEYSDFSVTAATAEIKKEKKSNYIHATPLPPSGRQPEAEPRGTGLTCGTAHHRTTRPQARGGMGGRQRLPLSISLYILSLTLHCHGHIHNHSHYHIHISPRLPAILQVYARYAAFMHPGRIGMHSAGHARRVRRKRRKDRTPRAAG